MDPCGFEVQSLMVWTLGTQISIVVVVVVFQRTSTTRLLLICGGDKPWTLETLFGCPALTGIGA